MSELTAKQEDFLLEQGMEEYYEKKYPDDIEYSKKEFCCRCGNEFDVDDLDRCDDMWICRECEEDLK